MNISKRSRIKLVWFASLSLLILGGYSIYASMDLVAGVAVGALAAIVQQYTKFESESPSIKRKINQDLDEQY